MLLVKGLDGLIKGVNWIIQFFKEIYQIIGTLLHEIVLLRLYLAKVGTTISTFIIMIPVWLRAFITLGFAIMILYMVLGRSTGKSGY